MLSLSNNTKENGRIQSSMLSILSQVGRALGFFLLSITLVLGAKSQANAATITLGGNSIWDVNDSGQNLTGALAGDDVVMTSHSLTISNASLAAGVNDANDITSTTGNLIIHAAANSSNAGVVINSFAGSSTADISLTNANNASNDGAVDLTVTTTTSTGGALSLVNLQAGGNAGVMAATFTGAATIGGTTTMTGVAAATSLTNATFTANATLTGTVTMTGATGAVTLNLNGATVSAAGGIVLAGTEAKTFVNFTSTAASEFTGVINASDGTPRGTVQVLGGSNLVTFKSAIGTTQDILALNVGVAATGGNAKFEGAVEAATITVHTQEDNKDATADFDGAVTATTGIVITGGNASGEDATATFAANVTTAAMTFTDGSGLSKATFDGTAAGQTVVGNLVAGTDGHGILVISNTHTDGVTFNDDVGTEQGGAKGLDSVEIASGSTMTIKGLIANDDLSFDVVGDVDDGSGTPARGGNLIIEGGDGSTTTTGDDIQLSTVTGNTFLTSVRVQGGDGATTGAGGAVASAIFTGTTQATTYSVVGGLGGIAAGGSSGAGGAVATFLQTGATTATNLYLTGGNGGAGIDNDESADAGDGGAVGSGSATFTNVVTADVTIAGGAGGLAGDGGAGEGGGDGGAGGAVTATDFTNGITGSLVVNGGNGANGGLGGASGETGGAGGAGGLATVTDVSAGGTLVNVTIQAGTGGTGGASAAANGGVGGAGGTVVVTEIAQAITGNLNIAGGVGGTGGAGSGAGVGGNGGDGTAIATLVINGAITGNVAIQSGAGGDSGDAGAGAGNSGAGGAGGAVATSINSNVGGTISIDDGSAGSAGAAGTGSAGSVGAASAVTLTFASQSAVQTVTGAVAAAADGEGAIVINNNQGTAADVTFASTVGTSTAALKSMTITDGDLKISGDAFIKTITGAAGDNMDFDGDVTAATALTMNTGTHKFAADVTASTSYNFAAAGTATFDGAAAQTITGAITATTDGHGDVNVTNTAGTVTFANKLGDSAANSLNDIALSASTTTVFDAAVDADKLDITSGTVTFNAAVTLDETFDVADGAKIIVGPDHAAGATVITAAGAPTDAGTVTIEMRPSALADGATITVFDAAGGTVDATYTAIDTALYDFTAAADDTDKKVVVTASKRSTSAIASNLGIATGAAAALDKGTTALSGAADAALSRTLNALLVAGGAPAKKAAEQIQNDPAAVSSAGSAAVTATGTQVIAVGSSRMAALRTGEAYANAGATGFASGNGSTANALWMKPFANWGDQSERKGIAGFENETFGVAFGGDVKIDNSTFGLSLSYANTDVDSKAAGNAQNDIDSYQATFYTDYTTSEWYVEGLIGYARNEISTSRVIDFAGVTASADYGSDQFMANIGGGVPVQVAPNQFITPMASMQYTLVYNNVYTETGAGSLNLRVDQDEIHVALLNAGFRYHSNHTDENGTWTPELRAGLTYDLAGDDGVSTNIFNGGGAAFDNTGADVVELGYKAGVGLAFTPLKGSGLTVSANYDTWIKEDFVSHNANMSLRFAF